MDTQVQPGICECAGQSKVGQGQARQGKTGKGKWQYGKKENWDILKKRMRSVRSVNDEDGGLGEQMPACPSRRYWDVGGASTGLVLNWEGGRVGGVSCGKQRRQWQLLTPPEEPGLSISIAKPSG